MKRRLRLLRWLLGVWREPIRPPRPNHDPELAAERLRANRSIARTDQVIARRERLDAAVDATVGDMRLRRQ